MRLSVIGTGYVGLVTGVCLARQGHAVACVDIDRDKVARIARGEPPIFEEGLESLLGDVLGNGFEVTADLEAAVHGSEVTFIAVGTPFDGEHIDLQYVRAAAREVGAALHSKDGYHVVVVKSTVVPGTTRSVVAPIVQEASGRALNAEFGVGMNPEFLTEGTAIADFMHPDRIVLGALDARALEVMAQIYAPFAGVPVIRTNPDTAEMIKYASNALLATMISFSNELGRLCSASGNIDIVDVMRGVHASQYLTLPANLDVPTQAPIARFLEAGCGFGGSCLPKDVKALVAHGRQAEVAMPMLEATLAINATQPEEVIRLLQARLASLDGARVTVLGLAFKPDTDDVRETPALPIVRMLSARGARVRAHDPVAIAAARASFGDLPLEYVARLEDALAGADAVVLVTRWKDYERVPQILEASGERPLLIDGRRVLDKTAVANYAGIGLGQE